MCYEDNEIIFQISQDDEIKIPPMCLEDFKNIWFKKTEIGKGL